MRATETASILDRAQLRDVTLDDPGLIKEILETLVEDTSAQLNRLVEAVRAEDAAQCARLAHYCKGACANVGAERAAAVLLQVESRALAGDLQECEASLPALARELELLRIEAGFAVNERC